MAAAGCLFVNDSSKAAAVDKVRTTIRYFKKLVLWNVFIEPKLYPESGLDNHHLAIKLNSRVISQKSVKGFSNTSSILFVRFQLLNLEPSFTEVVSTRPGLRLRWQWCPTKVSSSSPSRAWRHLPMACSECSINVSHPPILQKATIPSILNRKVASETKVWWPLWKHILHIRLGMEP